MVHGLIPTNYTSQSSSQKRTTLLSSDFQTEGMKTVDWAEDDQLA